MSWTEFAASPVFSSITGGIGALVGGIMNFLREKRAMEHQEKKWVADREMATLMGNIDQAKLAGTLALTREQGNANAFSESIKADAALKGESRSVTNFRAFTRPGLTWLYQAATLLILALSCIAWWQKWCESFEVLPIIRHIVEAVINLATMSSTWWFGQRQLEKTVLVWGNKSVGASVQSSTERTTPALTK